jgi:hypothetical protein
VRYESSLPGAELLVVPVGQAVVTGHDDSLTEELANARSHRYPATASTSLT